MSFFPANLKNWTLKTRADVIRSVCLSVILCLVFAAAAYPFYFHANDAFVSFRYVSNALKGFGYVWNPPPFAPVDGYTSFLWLVLLHILAKTGLSLPVAADAMTYLFSMGTVGLCFAFLRRTQFPDPVKNKSLFLFLIVCFILLTNTTFLAFMSSGTEAALFNFLVLLWVYEASAKDGNALRLTLWAALLAMTRIEGIVFLPACLPFLALFLYERRTKRQVLWTAAALLPFIAFYFFLRRQHGIYASWMPNSFWASYEAPFPPFAKDYLISFVTEYGLYFWTPVVLLWLLMYCVFRRFQFLIIPAMLALPFMAYIAWIVVLSGGDALEYRLLGFFIPLCLLAGIRMMTQNISQTFRFVCVCLLLYWICATPVSWSHYFKTRSLNTRGQTTFLYRPVSEKFGIAGFPARVWNDAQKRLISQGVALRRQEHKVLTNDLAESLPSREKGALLKWKHSRLLAWNIAGLPSWVFPETYIIDLSGQNDLIAARSPLQNPRKRRLGSERAVPQGYVTCFNGGTNIKLTPFDGKPDVTYLPSAPLDTATIRGCEAFWRSRVKEKEAFFLKSK